MVQSSAPPVPDSLPRHRVLRIVSRLNVGGIATHVILLTQGMEDSRYEVTLVSGHEDPREGNMLDHAERHGVIPRIVPELGRTIHPAKDWKAFLKIYRLIKELRPTIVDTHAAKAGTLGRIAARLAGVPVVIHTYHGHVLTGYFGRAKSWVFKTLETLLARRTDQVIMVSRQGREELVAWEVVPPEKIAYVPLGLELSHFASEEFADQPLKTELGLERSVPLVGIVARLVPIKDHDTFLRGAARVLAARSDARFALVGDGELRESLEARCADLGIRDKVIFTGFRGDLERVYSSLDIVVLTSINEGLPLTIIESMAAKRPVVATNVGGVGEMVEEEVTGHLIPVGDDEALADRILRLLKDPGKRKQMGRTGQERVMARYGKERLLREMIEMYDALLEKKGIPRTP